MDSGTRSTSEYKKIPLEEIFNLLKASADGLAGSEAGKRLEIFGYDEIAEEKKSLLLEFLRHYWGTMPWLLELAMGLSFILAHYLEGALILALLTVNAVIGHFHEGVGKHRPDRTRHRLDNRYGQHKPQDVLGFSALCALCIDFPKFYVFEKFGL